MSPEAMAIAADLAKKVARAKGTHADKFNALVSVIAALGVPDKF